MDNDVRILPISELKTDQVADELSRSEGMKPYFRAYAAMAKGDAGYLEEIRHLPLGSRYLWRVFSALKWALADLDTGTARMDLQTLPESDLNVIREELAIRLVQLRMLVESVQHGR